jgi:O-antigen/teichoic acid export membrane protein
MSVRRNMLWMAASQASVFVTQFIATVVLARLLSPYEMGVFAAAMAVVGLLAIVRILGLGSYVIRAAALTPEILETTFTINALLSLLIAAAVAGLSVLGEAMLDEPGVRRVLLTIAIVPLLSIFEFRPATVMERNGQFGSIAFVNLLRALASSVLTIVLAYDGHSYMSLAYGQVVGAVVGVAAFNVAGRRHASLRMGLSGWRGVLTYGGHMLAISGTSAAAARLAELALARLLGLGALGMYARAGGVANMVWDNVNLVVARALFVDLAEQRRQGRSLRSSYLRVVEMMTGLLWPAFAGLAVVSGPVVVALYGTQWVGAQVPLSLLALSSLPSAATVIAGPVFMVTERTADQARFEGIRAAAGLVLFLGGCMLGLNWAAGARILEALLAFALCRTLVQRMTDSRERDFTPIYLRSAALTMVAVAPAAAVMAWYGWSALAPFATVVAAALSGVLLWAGLLCHMRHPLYHEARWMLARVGLGRAIREAP